MLIINLLMAFSSVILGEFAEPPTLKITRDDHVATLEMDFNETAGWGGQLWNVSADGTEPIGYKIQWWPDPTDTITMIKGLGCSQDKSSGLLSFATEDHPHQMITANHVVQLQPLANDVTYHVSVSKLNSLGEECSAPTLLTFEGGDGTRVQGLQAEMTFLMISILKRGLQMSSCGIMR